MTLATDFENVERMPRGLTKRYEPSRCRRAKNELHYSLSDYDNDDTVGPNDYPSRGFDNVGRSGALFQSSRDY